MIIKIPNYPKQNHTDYFQRTAVPFLHEQYHFQTVELQPD